MSRLAQLYASLEDNVEPVFSTPEEEKDNELKVLEANLALNEDGKEIEKLDDDGEKLKSIASGVDNVAAEMRALINNGGSLSVEAAVFAHHAINAHLRQIGLTADEIMPSLESFSDPDNREYYSQIALEAAEKTSTTLWEKLVKLWNYIKTKIANFYKSFREKISSMKTSIGNYIKKSKNKGSTTTGKVKPEDVPGWIKDKDDADKPTPKASVTTGKVKPEDVPGWIKDKDKKDSESNLYCSVPDHEILAFNDSIKITEIIKGMEAAKHNLKVILPNFVKYDLERFKYAYEYLTKTVDNEKHEDTEFASTLSKIHKTFTEKNDVKRCKFSGDMELALGVDLFLLKNVSEKDILEDNEKMPVLSSDDTTRLLVLSQEILILSGELTELVDEKSELCKLVDKVVNEAKKTTVEHMKATDMADNRAITIISFKKMGSTEILSRYTRALTKFYRIQQIATLYAKNNLEKQGKA